MNDKRDRRNSGRGPGRNAGRSPGRNSGRRPDRNSDRGPRSPDRRRDRARDRRREGSADNQRDGRARNPDRRARSTDRRFGADNKRDGRARDPERHEDGVERRAKRRADWGGVARRGAKTIALDDFYTEPEPPDAALPTEQTRNRSSTQERARPARPPRGRQSSGPSSPMRGPPPGAPPVSIDEASLVSVPRDARLRVRQQLKRAARHFAQERFSDARASLGWLLARHREIPEVVELEGLCLYRLGEWKRAAEQLERFIDLTGTTEQHPVLADCYRGLGDHDRVAQLWDELRASEASAPTMAEGRIVAAGSLADADNLPAAISLLAKGPRRARHLADHHLRTIYALADLYEQAGDTQRARRGFERIAEVDPKFLDVKFRLSALGAP